MQGYYQILSQAEFDDWMAQQQATLAASLPPLDAAAAPQANADGAPAVAPTEQAGEHGGQEGAHAGEQHAGAPAGEHAEHVGAPTGEHAEQVGKQAGANAEQPGGQGSGS
jgi:hypothetical protein